MPCNSPLMGWVGRNKAWTGKLSSAISSKHTMDIPCGQCIGCRQDKRREWALRILNEKITTTDSIFLTLTYDNEHLPDDSSLVKSHIQKFFKRLRRAHPSNNIRYFVVGEYGDDKFRPHYHAIIFNYFPDDSRKWDSTLYYSKKLNKIWDKGMCAYGNVTYDSASYCSKYTTKRLTGDMKTEYGNREPEFALMSRRPAIGYDFLQKYKHQIMVNGYLTIEGNKISLPKYYKRKLDEEESENPLWQKTKEKIRDSVPNLNLEILDRKADNRTILEKRQKIFDKPQLLL